MTAGTASFHWPPDLEAAVSAELDAWRAGDKEVLLQAARLAARATFRVATCVGFGPRYLHSTGQASKGGPNSGVFIQIICDDPDDLAVPARRYSFGVVKAAQALGDFRVLQERGRRALRVHLGSDVKAGLALLGRALEA